jgi:heme/copper-type cytochrome/quinol oxidase subunit 1
MALAAVLAGVVMAIYGATKPRAYGWFAYAPLSETTFHPESFVLVDPWAIAGLVLLVAGLLVLAFTAGYRMGGRP